jgi:hypothetical protein
MAIHLGRREFITLLGGAAVSCRAQALARIRAHRLREHGNPDLELGHSSLAEIYGLKAPLRLIEASRLTATPWPAGHALSLLR